MDVLAIHEATRAELAANSDRGTFEAIATNFFLETELSEIEAELLQLTERVTEHAWQDSYGAWHEIERGSVYAGMWAAWNKRLIKALTPADEDATTERLASVTSLLTWKRRKQQITNGAIA
jgi:hypothetical protein